MKPVVIAGPTASGKSALALAIAEQLHGEIVCADSRQVYAHMPIATAAPTGDETKRIPHHLYGAVDPATTAFTAALFADRADALVDEISARGHVPIVVGGTGLYLRAWRLGLDPKDHDAPRATASSLASRDANAGAGGEAPPPRPRDMDAMLRRPPRFDARWLLVDAALDVLEPRIRTRARAMFDHGIVDEARSLRARLPAGHRLLDTLGIAEALAVADGAIDVDTALARTSLRTRQYARRQRTWFKKESWWTKLDATSATLVNDALSLLGEAR